MTLDPFAIDDSNTYLRLLTPDGQIALDLVHRIALNRARREYKGFGYERAFEGLYSREYDAVLELAQAMLDRYVREHRYDHLSPREVRELKARRAA